jgi:hypothetical protein
MAAKRKPAIGLGPIKDDLAKMLVKALSGAAGSSKKSQATRVVSKIEKKNPVLRSAGNNSVQTVKGKASKIEGQFARSRVAKTDKAKTTAMANKFGRSQSGKGLKWDGSPTEGTKAYKAGQSKAERDLASKSAKETMVNKNTKVMNKIDVETARGTGRTVSPTTGKVRYVPKGRAAEGRSRAGAMGAGVGKRNADAAKVQSKLVANVDNAKTPAGKVAARRALREHRGKYGNFGK